MNDKKEIWDILLTKVAINDLGKTITCIQNDDGNIKKKKQNQTVQIFELLVAETLNLYDNNVLWEITRAAKDGGVDLYGTSKKIIKTPFSKNYIKEISLGQIKHTSNSGYGLEKVKVDLFKLQNAWLCRRTSNCTLRQFLFVLATDNDNYVNKLSKELYEHSSSRDIANLEDYANITMLDGNLLMKSWKLNFSYFKEILKNALSNSDLDELEKFVNSQSDAWLDINMTEGSSEDNSYFVGETFSVKITIANGMPYLNSRLYLKWRPADDNTIQIMYPLNAADSRSNGIPLSKTTEFLQGQSKEFNFVFRGTQAGKYNLGNIDLCYENGKAVKSILLSKVNFLSGIFPDKIIEPTHIKEYNELIEFIKNKNCNDDNFKCFVVTGCGGLGKSTLISELIYGASGNGFSCISIQHPKDKIHEREVIVRLFNKLIYPESSSIFRVDQAVKTIKRVLRLNFEDEWEASLIEYLSGKNQISEKIIAECLATLIITISVNSRLFIWISDLHWGGPELFGILGETLDILERNKELFENRVIILFEGRDGETLKTKNFYYSPENWLNFLENGFLRIINLPLWSKQECEEFLKTKFSFTLNDGTTEFINEIVKSSNSVPMHIVQNINLMLENKILGINDEQQLVILSAFDKKLFSNNIIETINNRIDYYEKKFKLYIEMLVIVAKWEDKVNSQMNDWIIDKLNLTESGKNLVKQSGFINDLNRFNHRIKFRHEHYLTAFNEHYIKNDKLVDECLNYYSSLPVLTDDDKLKIIALKRLFTYKDYNNIYNECVNLLINAETNDIKLSVYKIIEEIQDNVSAVKIPKYEIYFEICELILRSGNWNEALTYLNKVFVFNEDCIENICCRLKSYQEYANIQADRLFFDDSIEKAEFGIKLADESLNNKKYQPYYGKLNLLKEKLQARLAVCYWFSGNFKLAYAIQKACLQNAINRGDSYSTAHITYEIATLEFHWLYNEPSKKMKNILSSFNTRPIPYLEHEKNLIEIQLLIGKALHAVKNNNDVITIINKVNKIIDSFRIQSKVYEEFLCRTIRAMCFFYQKKYADCLNDLMVALNKSTYSNMPNLEWKAFINIAQFLHHQGNKNCVYYALMAVDVLSVAINSNKKTAQSFKTMIKPVISILENILHKNLPEFEINEDNQINEMLAADVQGVTFFIMN